MRILAIDTATESCTVGLLNNGVQDTLSHTLPQQHASLILPMIDQLLSQHKLHLSQLDAFAVTVGPGSFTGIRIGVSVIQGLAFAVAKPVIPLSTLAVLAQGAYRTTGLSHIVAGIDARMGEIYWGEYQVNQTTHNVIALDVEQLIQPESALQMIQTRQQQYWGYAGSAWQNYCQVALSENKQAKNSHIVLPIAEDLLTLAEFNFSEGKMIQAQDLEPVYLRNNVAHQSNKNNNQ